MTDNLTVEEKATIDAMGLEEMLRLWRFGASDPSYFEGERGKYFSSRMFGLRGTDPAAWTAASKQIGW